MKLKDALNESTQYKSVNDAADLEPALAKGSTEIWYWKQELSRDIMMGPEFAKEQGIEIDPKNLGKTHVLIGKVKSKDEEEIFKAMQGMFWSPQGEARALIQKSGTGHTSMSVGDIIKIGSKVRIADMIGFKTLK